MKLSFAVCMAAVFSAAGAAADKVAAPPKPAGAMRRHLAYNEQSEAVLERVRRAQVDPKRLRIARFEAADDSNYQVQRRNLPSTSPGTCPYNGPQPCTAECQQQPTSDGCTSPNYYSVEPMYLQLLAGNKFQANGHVNFQYITLSQYRGYGSKRSPDPQWTPISAGIHFDPNNNQPGTKYIGQDWLPWAAAASLPSEGYCIIWVQVSNFNAHYGEGGQGPVCYCPTSTRKLRL